MKEQLIFCEKYGINATELMLLTVLLIAQEGDDDDLVNTYFSSRVCVRGNTRELLVNLQNAGIINKSYKIPDKGNPFNPLDVSINKNFIKDFYKCSFDIGKELFEAYPQFGYIQGNPVGIRSVSKKFDSLEDFYRFYGKSIRWNPDKHKEILELVEWAKENNILVTTLCNFVIDQKWTELKAIREGDLGTLNMDAIKLV